MFAGMVLLVMGLSLPNSSQAAPVTIDPNIQIGDLPAAGIPSFVFNGGANSFGGTIQSWNENYIFVQNSGGANGTYTMYAHNEGSFTYWALPTPTPTDSESSATSYSGTSGQFNLIATFDGTTGAVTGGSVEITGSIAGIGITDATTTLMTAQIFLNPLGLGPDGFQTSGDTVGFAIDNIICDDAIVGCANFLLDQNSLDQIESIYFGLAGVFPGITELNGMNYQSTMTNKTTVPIPATAWLMLSGLGWLGFIANRRRNSTD
jgi:hypothetical protein